MNWQRINSRMKHNARTVKVLGDDYRSVTHGNKRKHQRDIKMQ